jgi:type IV pilus assembly protein PilA
LHLFSSRSFHVSFQSETTPSLFPTSYDVNRMLFGLRQRRRPQRGFSLIELLIVIAIILIILSIALPQMSKARMHAQEMAAVEEVQTINKMEIQYYSQFGQYATALNQLGPPVGAGTAEGPQAAGLIPASLAGGTVGGYIFALAQTPAGYAVTAIPKSFGSTGRRTFYSDQNQTIHENWGQEPATVNNPELSK